MYKEVVKMFVNVIDSYRKVVAVADDGLVGKQFYEGKKQLDVKVSFYKGELDSLEKDEVIEVMKEMLAEDATFNIVGEESVAAAVEAGIITKDEILTIDGIPYSLILL